MEKRLTIIYTFILHGIAGYLNALTIMIFGQMTGVHTGNISNVFINFFEGDHLDAWSLLLCILSFFAGNILIGFLSEFEITYRTRYWQLTAFHLLSAIFFFVIIHFDPSVQATINVISFRLGIQNGLPVPETNHRKTTTSLTGLMTTVGVGIGRTLRSRTLFKLSRLKREALYLTVFVAGTSLAAIMTYHTYFDERIVFIILELLAASFCLAISFTRDGTKYVM